MTLLATQPQAMAAAAADMSGIRAAVDEVRTLVAGPTAELAAAAADEVSVAFAALFGAYAREAQAVLAQALTFGDQFAGMLSAAARRYVEAEVANASAALGGIPGLLGVSTPGVAVGAGLHAAPSSPPPKPLVALVMGGTGDPSPPSTYVKAVDTLFIQPNRAGAIPQVVFTPEQLYPLTGVRSLPFDTSVGQGVAILHDAVLQQLGSGNHVTVFGYSQSAEIASLEMRQLAAMGAPSPADLDFVLIGDPMNPNGGLLQRFAGLTLPSLGVSMVGATPDNVYPTTIYTREYDGLADFPRYPLNFVSDLNAFFGIGAVHFGYPHLTPDQVDAAYTLSTQGPTMTTYKMIPTANLPLLDPWRVIPFVGNPLADLVQPDVRVIVNLGYGDPAYGWSTSPANVPTPFGLFPAVSPLTVLDALAAGTQQGVQDFLADLPNIFNPPVLQPLWPDMVAALVGPAPPAVAPTPENVANAVASIISTDYAVLLPTADVTVAAALSLPVYDATLFVHGLENGSLLHAIGDPIAANTAMLTMAGLLEALTIAEAGVLNVGVIHSLIH
ncbi:PE family protein [Mycobacterium sp. ML4]